MGVRPRFGGAQLEKEGPLRHHWAVRPTPSFAHAERPLVGAIYAFSLSPLSRASRPFIAPILKGNVGVEIGT
jgi:hypothetical protein